MSQVVPARYLFLTFKHLKVHVDYKEVLVFEEVLEGYEPPVEHVHEFEEADVVIMLSPNRRVLKDVNGGVLNDFIDAGTYEGTLQIDVGAYGLGQKFFGG
jgi:hypothetical protein